MIKLLPLQLIFILLISVSSAKSNTPQHPYIYTNHVKKFYPLRPDLNRPSTSPIASGFRIIVEGTTYLNITFGIVIDTSKPGNFTKPVRYKLKDGTVVNGSFNYTVPPTYPAILKKEFPPGIPKSRKAIFISEVTISNFLSTITYKNVTIKFMDYTKNLGSIYKNDIIRRDIHRYEIVNAVRTRIGFAGVLTISKRKGGQEPVGFKDSIALKISPNLISCQVHSNMPNSMRNEINWFNKGMHTTIELTQRRRIAVMTYDDKITKSLFSQEKHHGSGTVTLRDYLASEQFGHRELLASPLTTNNQQP